VKSKAEQGVIWPIRQYRVSGLSLRQIAGRLNQCLGPTRNSGIWQANTVREQSGNRLSYHYGDMAGQLSLTQARSRIGRWQGTLFVMSSRQ
jgi:hypothetical protein